MAYILKHFQFSIGKVGVASKIHVEIVQNQVAPVHRKCMVSPNDTHLLTFFHQIFRHARRRRSSALTFVFSTPCWEVSPKHLMLTVERDVSVEKEASGIPVGIPTGAGYACSRRKRFLGRPGSIPERPMAVPGWGWITTIWCIDFPRGFHDRTSDTL